MPSMEGKGSVSEYRSMLDKTLATPELTKKETIHKLVKKQILKSLDSQLDEYIEDVVEKRSKEMFNFLGMLRSASASVERSKSNEELQSSWKVKEDTDEFRVMYREGTAGTPFHSLLVEGYVDGPLDVCLCISCESDLYKKWWPQTALPSFKITTSQCVKKVRIGEQISLLRMKVSWPLSSREALVHFFALEYLQEGLIVVLLNTISDVESIDKSTHGFTRDGIPDAQDVVRIDVVGGFAIQKVTADRSYFRTIANMDIKLDFIPPAFINFISRQLVGSGFKLYKKEIASVTKGGEKFCEALKDPMYRRIHEALYSQNKPLAPPSLDNPRSITLDLETKDLGVRDRKKQNEIEELEEREEDTHNSCDIIINSEIIEEEAETEVVVTSSKTEQSIKMTNDIKEHFGHEVEDKVSISPGVQRALGTLEKAISILRGYNGNSGDGQPGIIQNEDLRDSDKEIGEKLIPSERDRTIIPSKVGSLEASLHESKNHFDNHGSRPKVSISLTRETKQSKIAPDESPTTYPYSSIKNITVTARTLFDSMAESFSLNGDANITKRGRVTKRNNKKARFCCFVAQQESQG